jgi:formamidopyrimidine-DNA glycosylase
MPELPEVETVCRGLAKYLTGQRILNTTVRRRDLRLPIPATLEAALKNRTIRSFSRRAKYILIHLDNKDVLIVHLGMSGSMVLKKPATQEFRTHDHVVMSFANGMQMLFHDPRRFGLMLLANESALAQHKLFAALGPEPLDASWNGERLYKVLQASSAPVKSVIMDQGKVVGVGNIYACEALFLAKIHPSRRADKVSKKEAGALAADIKKVLNAAIKSGGSTLRDYVRSSGDAGYFQHHFNVYGRQKLPCVVCKNPISVIKQSGRSTFFCGYCQK